MHNESSANQARLTTILAMANENIRVSYYGEEGGTPEGWKNFKDLVTDIASLIHDFQFLPTFLLVLYINREMGRWSLCGQSLLSALAEAALHYGRPGELRTCNRGRLGERAPPEVHHLRLYLRDPRRAPRRRAHRRGRALPGRGGLDAGRGAAERPVPHVPLPQRRACARVPLLLPQFAQVRSLPV